MKTVGLIFTFIFLLGGIRAQNVGIGTSSPAPSAALDITSATGGLLVPRLTIAQRAALTPVEGMIIYNTDLSKFQGYGLSSEQSDQFSLTSTNQCVGLACGSKWQSFTQGTTGILTSVRIEAIVYAGAGCIPANLTMKIHSGAGVGGPVLQTTNFVLSSAGAVVATIPFHTPVTAGSIYTLEFTSPS